MKILRTASRWGLFGMLSVAGVACATAPESAPASYGSSTPTTAAIGPEVRPGDDDIEARKQRGAAVYREHCAACHQADGAGLQGAFPPLRGTGFIVGDEDPLIRTVLFGLSGPIEVEGVRYDGQMPAHASLLSDDEIAAVLTYVRASWGNKASPVHTDDVARQRLHPEVQPPR